MISQKWFRVALGMFLVACGANLFAPMVVVYQVTTELGVLQTTFLFGIYALGIMVALFIGGPLSDSLGRRAIMRPAVLITTTGSLVFLGGAGGAFLPLLIGRLCAGAAVGFAMSSGAAWIKELSTHLSVGAKRSSIALSAGFASAPGVAGIAAEFLPWPTVLPYLLHIGLALVVVPLVWTVPEQRSAQTASSRRSLIPTSLLSPRYLPVVAYAPWVFGSATTAFVFLPAQLSEHLRHPILIAGLCALLTMGSGVVIQQLAGRIRVTAFHGMVLAAIGMALCLVILAAAEYNWAVFLLPLAAIIMGSSYGIGMLSGLAETQAIAHPAELGAATGVFYSLTYLGFFAPFILSLLGPVTGYSTAFIIGLAVAALTAVALRLRFKG
ncbi:MULTISPECIES: MFS transporter [unclassified Corynebacterium]|uniref:MFS transporter n=1 Tax=unclassified Corynebacterium TaxID=2624378 RepID=UPI0008A55AD7|nr:MULTISPECIES: MFS transporter [unclassified Corynebacterium]OFN78089.1 MFS transporter [Corynebacterium sp. HMSC074E01]OFP65852.1 MFS transporter [Corynebacterium sp. HMSC074C01]OHO62516.1 MFS transporter [Corynebacterium sp. HMSC036D02]